MGTLSINSGTVLLTGIPVASNSCADVLTALVAEGALGGLNKAYVPVGCSVHPVVPTTLIFWRSVDSKAVITSWTVTGISANDPFNFDYAYASGLWMMAFCFVLGLYLVAKKAGIILSFIRG